VLAIQPRAADEDMPAMFAFEAPAEAPRAPVVSAPSPPSPLKAAPVEPQPPTPPFAAFGRYVDQGTVAVFLQYAGRNIVARPGDRINDQYVLESINERDVTVLYVPLNLRQTLDIGSGR